MPNLPRGSKSSSGMCSRDTNNTYCYNDDLNNNYFVHRSKSFIKTFPYHEESNIPAYCKESFRQCRSENLYRPKDTFEPRVIFVDDNYNDRYQPSEYNLPLCPSRETCNSKVRQNNDTCNVIRADLIVVDGPRCPDCRLW